MRTFRFSRLHLIVHDWREWGLGCGIFPSRRSLLASFPPQYRWCRIGPIEARWVFHP